MVGGGATRRASRRLADRIKALAAHLLEADPEDLELRDGEAQVRGAPGKSVSFQEVARLAYLETHNLPEGVDPGLECTASFDPPGTFSTPATARSSSSTLKRWTSRSSATSWSRTAA